MRIGVPKEIKDHEYRVAITPAGARELTARGHEVTIERGAGVGSAIDDADYIHAGATIASTSAETWGADLVLKVKEPISEEYGHLRADQTLFTYLHLAASKPLTEALIASRTTAIAYETVELPDHRLPLLAPMSEVAGRMAPQVGAHLLEREQGGRGVLMGGLPGVAPATVVVLGAGMAGQQAIRIAFGMEARVIVLDTNVDKLREIDDNYRGAVTTLISTRDHIEGVVQEADLVIGSVLIPGAKTPKIVSESLVQSMAPGAVVVDIAIDQGGCFETSHVTTHSHPTYVVHDVVHYSVGNMPGAVPHTSTHGLTNATLPYVLRLAGAGAADAARDHALAAGINVWKGKLTNSAVGHAHSLTSASLDDLL